MPATRRLAPLFLLLVSTLPATAQDGSPLSLTAMVSSLAPAAGSERSISASSGTGTENSIDLLVGFEGNTHILTIDGMKTLRTLATALMDPSLERARFSIVAHAYLPSQPAAAQPLSTRRAQAVAEHLTGFYSLDATRFSAVTGAGAAEIRSANASDPRNQRIEIRRTGAQ
ncbi:OmpA family protein [Rhodobacteraceae bacterium SC52]|nr:OmpA family protein [Rhodobacteraceae bacterium SC52]